MANSKPSSLHEDMELDPPQSPTGSVIDPQTMAHGTFPITPQCTHTDHGSLSASQSSSRPEPSLVPSTPNSGRPRLSDELKKKLLAHQLRAKQSSNHGHLNNIVRSPTGDRTTAVDPQGENAWMEEHLPEGDRDAEEDESYEDAEAEYMRKKRRGENTDIDDINFKSLQKRHKAKQRKANEEAEHEMDDEMGDSLFIRDAFDDDDYAGIEDDLQVATNMDKSNGDGHLAMLDSIRALEIEQEAAAAKKSEKKRGTSKRPPKTLNNSTAKAKVSKSKPKALTKKQAAKTRERKNLLNYDSLVNHDVFSHAETNRGRDALPTFRATQKKAAMQELLASLPTEARKIAELDRPQVLKALRNFTGTGTCKSDGNGQWKVNGMISSLSHYQMLGVAAMRVRETQEEEPRGGILADAMGLGKTVMMIANIVNGRGRRHNGPTLIVAPASIVNQWMAEISKHAEAKKIGEVIRYHAGYRLSSNNTVESLSKFGIIVTTYSEIARSYPKWDPPINLTTTEEKDDWWESHYEKTRGPLHRIDFHRVILDEAQAIKNHKSQTSIAVRGLTAIHRWAISGTPVQNAISEFFPYFKFLKVPFTGTFKLFKRNFCSLDDASYERLARYLSSFMIRRGHEDMLMGAKLLNLPKPTRYDYKCHFSDIEREIYFVVRTRFVLRINGFSMAGQLHKKYNHILTMLLRLRQLVSHPLLIQDTLRDLLEPEDFAKIRKIVEEREVDAHGSQAAIIHHLREMLRAPKSLVVLDAAPTPVSEAAASIALVAGAANDILGTDSAISDPTPVGQKPTANYAAATAPFSGPGKASRVGGAFGLKDSWPEFVTELHETSNIPEEEVDTICRRCGLAPRDVHVTSCQHVYCYECLRIMSFQASEAGNIPAKCLVCHEEYSGCHPYNPSSTGQTLPGDANTGTDEQPAGSSLEGEKKPRTARTDVKQVIDTWVDANGHMLPSAKTLAIKAQLLNWMQENPHVKIIIYSQFLTMIHIISKMCAIEGWGYTQFTGLMSMDRRDKVVQEFETDEGMNIMIASLKTGGTGLNLTCASRVLIVDLWWNSAVEYQAFCRIYRRGQVAETAMTRLIVHDTVDTDMVKMQQRKDAEIGHILSDGDDKRKKLTLSELLSLFGSVSENDDGKAFIYVDERTQNRRAGRYAPANDDDDTTMGESVV